MITLALTLLIAADTRALLSSALAREFGLQVPAAQIELAASTPTDIDAKQGLALRRWGLHMDPSNESYRWGRVPDLQFRLPKLKQAIRLKHAMSKGEILREEDLEMTPVAWRPNSAADLTHAIGMECLRNLPAGHLLNARDLRSAAVVHRGDNLQAIQQSKSYVLRFPAISMRNGALGETILIRKPGQAKLLAATVRGAGLVELQ
jgi:flagella basal body P-ring formation protein FlgA